MVCFLDSTPGGSPGVVVAQCEVQSGQQFMDGRDPMFAGHGCLVFAGNSVYIAFEGPLRLSSEEPLTQDIVLPTRQSVLSFDW